VFEAPGFTFGEWVRPVSTEPGVMIMGYYDFSPQAMAFRKTCAELGWVRPDIDWVSWQHTPEAQRLLRDEDAVECASPEELAHLLTLFIRGDRFSEGALAEMYASGMLTRILRRAAVMAGYPQE
jgi:hypothetical protein